MAISFLVTGGNGFIGSHTVVELYQYLVGSYQSDFRIVVIDNNSNSDPQVIERVHEVIGSPCSREQLFLFPDPIDIRNADELDRVFRTQEESGYPIRYVIHFAGLKAVGESKYKPLLYYQNNVVGSLNLLESMKKYGCNNMIFSSSCTVYGEDSECVETAKHLSCVDPYGQTKLTIECMMRDCGAEFGEERQFTMLRYFNPCGAHPSGIIGEAPCMPNNLFPIVQEVVSGKRAQLQVYGNDYPTVDGTGVRDYIHVMDLAKGHVSAIKAQIAKSLPQYDCINLGSGTGYSVLQVIKAYSQVIGRDIPYEIAPRRPGDCASKWGIVNKASQVLAWSTTKSLQDMCRDSYNYAMAQNKR